MTSGGGVGTLRVVSVGRRDGLAEAFGGGDMVNVGVGT